MVTKVSGFDTGSAGCSGQGNSMRLFVGCCRNGCSCGGCRSPLNSHSETVGNMLSQCSCAKTWAKGTQAECYETCYNSMAAGLCTHFSYFKATTLNPESSCNFYSACDSYISATARATTYVLN